MRWMILIFSILSSYIAASEIPQMYRQVAVENNVPAKLFYAVVLNESRSSTRVGSHKKTLPWPWTVNHRGKPYFFESKEAAHNYISSLINSGDYKFDVGLGQINWYWHRERFEGAWEALDPYTNLSAAAKVLREQFDRPECNDWALAIGCYHRPAQGEQDKQIAKQYTKRVIALWLKI